MNSHRLLTISAGTILLLAVAGVAFWALGGLSSMFLIYSLAILAALGAALRLWFVNRATSEFADDHR